VKGNTEKNSTLITENAQLAAKLKNLLEQYEVREQVKSLFTIMPY